MSKRVSFSQNSVWADCGLWRLIHLALRDARFDLYSCNLWLLTCDTAVVLLFI